MQSILAGGIRLLSDNQTNPLRTAPRRTPASCFLRSTSGLGSRARGKKGELALAPAAHTGRHLLSDAAAPHAGGLRSIVRGATRAPVVGRCHHSGSVPVLFFPQRAGRAAPEGQGPHPLQTLKEETCTSSQACRRQGRPSSPVGPVPSAACSMQGVGWGGGERLIYKNLEPQNPLTESILFNLFRRRASGLQLSS